MEAGVPKRRTLHLTPEQRAELEHWLHHERRPYLREQAGALLKIADGMSPNAVAQFGLLRKRRPETVCGWLNYYEAHRALHVRPPCRGPSPQ